VILGLSSSLSSPSSVQVRRGPGMPLTCGNAPHWSSPDLRSSTS
jgi:hypothetical protein